MTERLHNPAQPLLDRMNRMLAEAEASGDTERALELRTDLAHLDHEWAQMEVRIRENGDTERVNRLLQVLGVTENAAPRSND